MFWVPVFLAHKSLIRKSMYLLLTSCLTDWDSNKEVNLFKFNLYMSYSIQTSQTGGQKYIEVSHWFPLQSNS